MKIPLLILFPLGIMTHATEPEVVVLRETIAKVVDLKNQTSQEKNTWELEKASMAQLLDLHKKELALLNEELATSGQSTDGYDAKKKEAESRIEFLKNSKSLVADTIALEKLTTLALSKRFPAPLLKEAAADIAKLKEWQQGEEPRQGLQAILGIVAQAEQFNRRLTRVKEERDGRQVEVLYLGLATAYYADRNGTAGIGTPGPDGWTWTEQNDVHDEVTLVLAQLDKKRPPELVSLPVKIEVQSGQ